MVSGNALKHHPSHPGTKYLDPNYGKAYNNLRVVYYMKKNYTRQSEITRKP